MVNYVLAVHDEVIQEIFEVTGWQVAGIRNYKTRDVGGTNLKRKEFNGYVVPDGPVRERYLHKSVKHLFAPGSQNPIRYAFADGTTEEEDEGSSPTF